MMRYVLAATALCVATPLLAQSMPPADYVMMAGASDLYERESSKLVLATTKNADVRKFATMMISAHNESTRMVKQAAAQENVKAPPPQLTRAQKQMITQLQAQKGEARDTAYIAQQRQAHDQALALQKNYAQNGTSAPLKAAAAKIVPVVEHHITMLKSM